MHRISMYKEEGVVVVIFGKLALLSLIVDQIPAHSEVY